MTTYEVVEDGTNKVIEGPIWSKEQAVSTAIALKEKTPAKNYSVTQKAVVFQTINVKKKHTF